MLSSPLPAVHSPPTHATVALAGGTAGPGGSTERITTGKVSAAIAITRSEANSIGLQAELATRLGAIASVGAAFVRPEFPRAHELGVAFAWEDRGIKPLQHGRTRAERYWRLGFSFRRRRDTFRR